MDNKNNEAVDGVVASEEISLEEQQAVLEKFDQESNTRNVTGFAKGFIKWYAIAMAVFHVYTSFFGLWATIRQRAMHLLFVMPLCYLMYPAKKGGARNNPSLLDWVFAALSFVCCGYIVVNYDAIFLRGGLPNQMDIIMGCLCALLVLEAVRRVVGTQLLIIAVIFLGYVPLTAMPRRGEVWSLGATHLLCWRDAHFIIWRSQLRPAGAVALEFMEKIRKRNAVAIRLESTFVKVDLCCWGISSRIYWVAHTTKETE